MHGNLKNSLWSEPLKLNAFDVKFQFSPYFMTENPTGTERNAIICPFFGVLSVFLLLISLKTSRYFNFLRIKNRRQKVFVGKK